MLTYRPKIVLLPTQGFCNRLRAMASAFILAKHLNTQFYLIWNKEECCNCDFHEIFTNTFDTITLEDLKNKKYLFSPEIHTNSIMHVLHTFEYIVIQGGHEFKHPEMSLFSFLRMKQQFYQSLQFTEEVLSVVNTTNTKMSANCVGIHFRDFVPKYDALDNRVFSEVSPIESFLNIIQQIYKRNNHTLFFVSSNTSTALNAIKTIIPINNILTLENIDTNRDTPTGVIHAVANLLLLSKCKYIVGTLMSSYSDEACFFNMISKVCVGHEEVSSYHCYGFSHLFGYKMLLPNVNILYDIYKEEQQDGQAK